MAVIYDTKVSDYLHYNEDEYRVIYGTDGDDVISAGSGGVEYVYGGKGNDTYYGADFQTSYYTHINYVFRMGDGNDVIIGSYGPDTMIFEDLMANEVYSYRPGYGVDDRENYKFNDMYFGGGRWVNGKFLGVSILVKDWFLESETYGYRDYRNIIGGPIFAEDAPLILKASNTNNYIRGASKNDQILGFAGDDTLLGEEGNDYLDGGEGSDTYVFKRNNGNDVLRDRGQTGNDVLSFLGDASITTQTITFSNRLGASNAGDVVLHYGTGSIVLDDQFLNNTSGLEYIHFIGESWNRETIFQKAFGFSSTDYAGYNPLVNNQKNIIGTDAGDVLKATANEHWLEGRNGNDLYVYGGGLTTIRDNSDSEQDILRLDNINFEDVTFRQSNTKPNLIMDINGVTHVVINNQFQGTEGIEHFIFADNVQKTAAQIDQLVNGMAGGLPQVQLGSFVNQPVGSAMDDMLLMTDV
jgi:hypothetical protein